MSSLVYPGLRGISKTREGKKNRSRPDNRTKAFPSVEKRPEKKESKQKGRKEKDDNVSPE